VTTGTGAKVRIRRSLDVVAFGFLVVGVILMPLIFWPWSTDVFVGPKYDALRVVTAAGAITAAFWLALGRPHLRWRLSDTAVVLLLALNLVAYWSSVDRPTSLQGETMLQNGLVTIFAFAGAYAIARVTVRTLHRLRALYAAVALAASTAAVYGLIQLVRFDPIWSDLPLGRVFSSIGQPNWLAAYLVLAIPLTVAWTISADRGPARLAGFGAVTVQASVLVATLSRSGYAGIMVAGIVGGAVALRRGLLSATYRRTFVATSAVLVTSVALAFVSMDDGMSGNPPESVARRAASAVDLGSFESQQYMALWKVGLAIAVDHPLTGTGQGTYAIVFPQYRDTVLDRAMAEHLSRFRPESAHNVYLSTAAAAGFPALVAYVALIVGAVVAVFPLIWPGRRESILLVGLVAALAGHAVTDWFMTVDLSGGWLFWALIGAGLAFADDPERWTADGVQTPYWWFFDTPDSSDSEGD
jgi:putative inorganic carbon (HCO3(-)) transporter